MASSKAILHTPASRWETFQLPLAEAKHVQLDDAQKQGDFPQGSYAELTVPLQPSHHPGGVLQCHHVPTVPVFMHTKQLLWKGLGIVCVGWLRRCQKLVEIPPCQEVCSALQYSAARCPSARWFAELDQHRVLFAALRAGQQHHRPTRESPALTDRAALQLSLLGSTT